METIFGVTQVPSDTQMREILDGAPTMTAAAVVAGVV